MPSPAALAQAQLDAYNAKDLDAFCACYAENVGVWRMPAEAPTLVGMAAFRERYASGPFAQPGVRAEVAQRIVLGDKVLDHEIVHGRGDTPEALLVVYHCSGGLISKVYFFLPG
ncbi:nuclear transport factor 2 family protein [Paucibacter sp. APW11]|uniref:Nuclear transport factor 2 family protein n=1 Tax=Roseateles aquae TaxID=3077235 RepID=A0ABU3PCX3_9BURK|nr:nuclear transport factor 2 family protein [Paucibacter sp. APW11]MDT9000426.1 nuclear transport factor 2 family protein [Paucibacter sp. APW11]